METKLPSFRRSLPMLLNYAHDAVMPAYRELFARYGLTEQQWRIFRVLWNDERINAVELSKRTLLPTSSLVGIIDRLEKKGLIARLRSETDRRQIYIITTAKGRALRDEVMPIVTHIQNHTRSSLSEQDWKMLEGLLGQITQSLNGVGLDEILDETEERKTR